MIAIANTATRTVLRRTTTSIGRRCLSVQGQEAVGRLKHALEQYRVKNYQQEIPSRFKKEMVSCAISGNDARIPTDQAAVESIEELLQNIGVFGEQVTHDDVERIVTELNEEHGATTGSDDSECECEQLRADQILSKIL